MKKNYTETDLYFLKNRKTLLIILVCSLFASIVSLAYPVGSKLIVDTMTNQNILEVDAKRTVLILTIFIIGMRLTGFLSEYIQRGMAVKLTYRFIGELREAMIHKLDRVPMSYFFKYETGSIMSKIMGDIDAVGDNLAKSIVNIISGTFMFVISIILMAFTNLRLCGVALLTTFVGGFLIMASVVLVGKYSKRKQESQDNINSYINENINGHSIVRAYNGEAESISRFEKLNEDYKNQSFFADFYGGIITGISFFTIYAGVLIICVVGLRLTISGVITIGSMVGFIGLYSCMSSPLGQIGQSAQLLAGARAALDRINGLLTVEEDEQEAEKTRTLTNCSGMVKFDHIKFGYDKETTIIQDFSLEVEPGQKVAIVGPTGAGKSTIINLLMRFYEIESGSILIDDVPISEMKREEVRKQFSIVLQEPWVFEGSLRDNITLGNDKFSDASVIKALEAVNLERMLDTCDKGLDTILMKKYTLSQGQKQQIAIARAFLYNKPILILDEATSSIDTRTEMLIQNALDVLTQNRTSFVIAHRLSTIKNADMILVLKNGEIVEMGRHNELIGREGLYKELYSNIESYQK